ncbi:MAG: hypothetical protein RIQ72_174, partial [Candidatus Parcubacteria bacterium]
MLFNYKVINSAGVQEDGSIDAQSIDIAVSSLQRRGMVVVSIHPADEAKGMLSKDLGGLFQGIKQKDIVILSRQMSTLFTSQVSALRIFKLLASETENRNLR